MAAAYSDDFLRLAPVAIAAVLLIAASLKDVALRILPNWITLGCALTGIAMRLADGTLPAALLVAACVFAGTLLCWRRGWLGGGDVKLLAACALLVPAPQILMLLILTAWCGGALAILYLLLGRILTLPRMASPRPGKAMLVARLWRIECRRIQLRAPLPYGCAIAGAALILLLGPSGPLGK